MLAEKAARRGLDAVQPVAEIHLVQIELENLRLGVHPLDARGEEELLNLPMQRLVGREETLTGELLGNRAGALSGAAAPDVGQRGGSDADEIVASVFVESLILDRGQRVNDVRRYLGKRNVDALFLVDREDQSILFVEHRRRLIHLADFLDGHEVGEAVAERDDEPAADDHRGHRHQRCDDDDAESQPRVTGTSPSPLQQ